MGSLIVIDCVVMRKHAPRARNMPASVTMNGCNRKKWISAPIAAPYSAPSRSISGTITHTGQCRRSVNTARGSS